MAADMLVCVRMNRAKYASYLIVQSRILIVDDNPFMRSIVRSLLLTIGAKKIYEARDGIDALEQIRSVSPDIVILDWEMPLLNGPELVRIVRSPGVFPMPDVPIIMLSGHSERRRILGATKIGVNEFLCKPVSMKALQDRIVSILMKPRANVQLGDYYGPEPRGQMPEPEAERAAGNPIGVNDIAVESTIAVEAEAAPAAVPAIGDNCFDIDTLTRVRPTTIPAR